MLSTRSCVHENLKNLLSEERTKGKLLPGRNFINILSMHSLHARARTHTHMRLHFYTHILAFHAVADRSCCEWEKVLSVIKMSGNAIHL